MAWDPRDEAWPCLCRLVCGYWCSGVLVGVVDPSLARDTGSISGLRYVRGCWPLPRKWSGIGNGGDGVMSDNDYLVSVELAQAEYSFDALIMAAMRQADTDNLNKLKLLWPYTWAELQRCYRTPGLLDKLRWDV